MKARFTSVLVACALLTSAVGTANGQLAVAVPGQCYGSTGGSSGTLVTIDTVQGLATNPLATGVLAGLPGLAIDNSGRIFASSTNGVLYQLDAENENHLLIGTLPDAMGGLAFDSNGRLIGITPGGDIYEVDPDNFGYVYKGSFVSNLMGLAFDSQDVLYATAGGSPYDCGNDCIPVIEEDDIGILDPETGIESNVRPLSTGIPGTPDLSFNRDGKLYVVKGGGFAGVFRLFSVDTSTNPWSAHEIGTGLGAHVSGFACDRRDPGGEIEDEKAFICHNDKIIEVSVDAVPAHRAHGDPEDLSQCGSSGNGPGRGPHSTGKADLAVPESFGLTQNYPNPFNPTTTISFALPEAASVRLAVYNALGQEVKVLVSSTLEAGTHSVTWNATDHAGQRVSTGLYIYRITAGDFVETRKMLLLE
jgi:hypothetical protein